jgi:hypothetical protein
MEQELLTLPEYLSSHQVFGGIRVARSLVFCVVFVYRCFVLSSFFLLGIVLSVLLWFMNYMITTMVSSNYIVFLNNTACLVQDQSIEYVTRQHYFYRYRYYFSTDFKEDGRKFTTTSELLSEFMIINFNLMKVHVYLSQWILVTSEIMVCIGKIFTISSIAYNNLVLVKMSYVGAISMRDVRL